MRRRLLRFVAWVVLAPLAACGGGTKATGQTLSASFTRLDGTTRASFADYRGKPMVVNFFSSTCVPCQTEMPAFEQVHRQVGDAVVFLGMDVQDTVASGQAFVESVGVTWEMGRDPDASILQSLGGNGLPTTVLVDPDGRVVFRHRGPLDVGELTKQLRQHGFTS